MGDLGQFRNQPPLGPAERTRTTTAHRKPANALPAPAAIRRAIARAVSFQDEREGLTTLVASIETRLAHNGSDAAEFRKLVSDVETVYRSTQSGGGRDAVDWYVRAHGRLGAIARRIGADYNALGWAPILR